MNSLRTKTKLTVSISSNLAFRESMMKKIGPEAVIEYIFSKNRLFNVAHILLKWRLMTKTHVDSFK